jgi:hydrogenase small subunit
MDDRTIGQVFRDHQVSRRHFLKFCAAMATTLALPPISITQIARALEQAKKPTVVQLEYQNCAGCVDVLLPAARLSFTELVLDILAVDGNETVVALAGPQTEKSFAEAVAPGGHIVMVDGAIPVDDGGARGAISDKTASSLLQRATEKAAAVIALGTCASFGGLLAADPNPAGVRSVRELVDKPVLNISGCPPNVDYVTATVVHYLTFGALPAADSLGRPLFSLGERINHHRERSAKFDAGQFVRARNDEVHRQRTCWCKMGCNGSEAYQDCLV